MPPLRKYPEELRERSVRLVADAIAEGASLSVNAAVKRIGPRVGVVPDTLRNWVKQHRIDTRQQPGVTTADATRSRSWSGRYAKLKRANEILLAASLFFAQELDPRLPW